MEIRDRKNVPAVSNLRTGAAAKPAEAPAVAQPPIDTISIAGIAEAELTASVRRALTTLMAEVETLKRELTNAHSRIAHLEKLVDEDPLVPIANRRAFVRELTRMMAFAQRYGLPASIVYFDVNNMKQINDTYGHAAGDDVLVQIAQVLLDNVRTTDVVGRLGGDEMGVLLVQTDQELAESKAVELSDLIHQRVTHWQGNLIEVSVASGAYAFAAGNSASDIIDAADRAMYQTKKSRTKEAS
jgi:diguanylate cyclase (GGDEF)-like protein